MSQKHNSNTIGKVNAWPIHWYRACIVLVYYSFHTKEGVTYGAGELWMTSLNLKLRFLKCGFSVSCKVCDGPSLQTIHDIFSKFRTVLQGDVNCAITRGFLAKFCSFSVAPQGANTGAKFILNLYIFLNNFAIMYLMTKNLRHCTKESLFFIFLKFEAIIIHTSDVRTVTVKGGKIKRPHWVFHGTIMKIILFFFHMATLLVDVVICPQNCLILFFHSKVYPPP